ncbi:MAG: insulinase family protein [Chlamydiia bacterium]|nr:insulinase family protein [Chlamydiia bacterium]
MTTHSSTIHQFEITRTLDLPEIGCFLTEAIHLQSKAKVIHLASDEEENLFCLSFRTHPNKSDGVAHILEHTVLCGSKRFPVRDPFFGMTRRSLNTFMNALTGADFTCYPAASCIKRDFYNLLDVYLDAVFHPNLDKLSFLQEGHRLEFSETGELLFKGIVLNEMKGAMADADSRLSEELMSSLFPDLTYGVNSGGDPSVIPDLTYEQLKNFHANFYHPSRCLFFFFGNLPLEEHLKFINEKALKGVHPLPPLATLPKQTRFLKKKSKQSFYPISPYESRDEKTFVGCSWLTCSILSQEELLALCVIDLALMGTDAAPLKKAILRSGLCKGVDSFLEVEMSEIPYTFVFRGCKKDSGENIENFFRSELNKIVDHGLPPHLVDGAIHQLEFARSEITGNSSPYGLSLFMRSALLVQHGGKPEDGLCIHSLFTQLRKAVQNPDYLTSLIKKWQLNNPHFVRVDLHPDEQLAAKEQSIEKEKLKTIAATLTDQAKQNIRTQTENLKKLQEDQNMDVLPKVTLADVEKNAKDLSLKVEKLGTLDLFTHACFTNGIIYATLAFDLPKITEEELPYLRLFSTLLSQVGCGGRTYHQTLDAILSHTGGINASLDLCLLADDPDQIRPLFLLKGKSLFRKSDKFFPLLADFVTSSDFTDRDRLKELLMQHLHSIEETVHQGSLRYAVHLAGSGLSTHGKILNTWYGMDYYFALQRIVKEFEISPQSLIERLENLRDRCLGLKGGHLIVSGEGEEIAKLKALGFYGIDALSQKDSIPWESTFSLEKVSSQGRITASPVAFTTLLFRTPGYLDTLTPALHLASEIMENKILHKRIREQGGAYGSGAVNESLGGTFYFFAYRDPHLASTLDAIEEAILTIVNGKFDEKELEEAKLGVIQELDSPVPPGSRGSLAYSRIRGKRTLKRRQLFRDRLLSCDQETIVQAASQYLLPGLDKGIIVSFAGKDLFTRENEILKEKSLPLFSIEP